MQTRLRVVLGAGGVALVAASGWAVRPSGASARHDGRETATPIKHLVVIYGENVSFDHYFGTYPKAANTDGTPFTAAGSTPAVNGLLPATSSSIPATMRHSQDLTQVNPNTALPRRLDSTAAGIAGGPGGQLTCDQNHEYVDEQSSFDGGRMDRFVQSVGTGAGKSPTGGPCQASQVMDYYDGNTAVSLWQYAQHFAMSDNSYGTTFGPSSPGALNLVSGTTGGIDPALIVNKPSVATPTAPGGEIVSDGKGSYTMIGDPQPYWDDCSTRDAVGMTGRNVGDLLNSAGVSWGWFEGGFRPTTTYQEALAATNHQGQPTSTFIPDEFTSANLYKSVPHARNQGICNAVNPVGKAVGGTGQYGYKDDYIPHHEPFQYYASTANPHHLTLPTDASGTVSVDALRTIGHDTQSYSGGKPQFDTPNHNYDMSDFDQLVAAVTAGRLPQSAIPAVTFLKAPGYQDGHAAYSDPKDEQAFVTREINALEASPTWSSTAVVLAYDDSDGWYDHAFAGVLNPSFSAADNLTDTTTSGATSQQCGTVGRSGPLAGQQGRCGVGPRLPLLVISPFARSNHVDHTLTDQTSILNLVEYNWGLPTIPGSADTLFATRNRGAELPFDMAGLFRFGDDSESRTTTLFLDPVTGVPTAPPPGGEGDDPKGD